MKNLPEASFRLKVKKPRQTKTIGNCRAYQVNCGQYTYLKEKRRESEKKLGIFVSAVVFISNGIKKSENEVFHLPNQMNE